MSVPSVFSYIPLSRMPLRKYIGTVVSAHKMEKTIVVQVPYLWYCKKVKMDLKRSLKVKVDDPFKEYDVGDEVEIKQSPKISKTKAFVVKKLLRKEPGAAIIRSQPEQFGEFLGNLKDIKRRHPLKSFSEKVDKS
eukprot:TRINITY_DN4855_c0_g1_i1.p2 TRINITY_DN4855_c0_g1~~TRINITY_DN4855_c0_g1_i1.p2  ORF type:complete len:135 (-),score=23.50 TRINITY_DN4855_c0_g1_i1:157-561(-)